MIFTLVHEDRHEDGSNKLGVLPSNLGKGVDGKVAGESSGLNLLSVLTDTSNSRSRTARRGGGVGGLNDREKDGDHPLVGQKTKGQDNQVLLLSRVGRP